MTVIEQIYAIVKTLPQNQASEILTFAQFIRAKYLNENESTDTVDTSTAEIIAKFADYLNADRGEPILITENGQPVAAMTLIKDPEALERFLLANNPKFNQVLDKSRQSLKEEGGLKSEDFWNLVGE
jgi:prevent-host-death family protein